MPDDITRYRTFFETHDLSGRPKRASAPSPPDELRSHANEIIAYAQSLKLKQAGPLTVRQAGYVESILTAACKILLATRG